MQFNLDVLSLPSPILHRRARCQKCVLCGRRNKEGNLWLQNGDVETWAFHQERTSEKPEGGMVSAALD